MSGALNARLGELDGVLDEQQVSAELAEQLFAVVDLLDRQPSLRRALTDPGIDPDARAALIEALFGNRISEPARAVVRAASSLRWGSTSGLSAALERQAVRATLGCAQGAGTLDHVEDELFRFGRLVDGDPGLRAAIGDRSAPLELRRALVSDLLAGKVDAATDVLAQRAVAARERSFDLTLDGYLTVAAALRDRAVAHVVTARPLTPEQAARLASALGRQLGREVTLQLAVDPEVIGGVRVTVGDELIEGTVADRLESARRQFN